LRDDGANTGVFDALRRNEGVVDMMSSASSRLLKK